MRAVLAIEGLDGVGKSIVVNRLAELLRATILRSPPALVVEGEMDASALRKYLDSCNAMHRRAYYRLGNVLVSKLAKTIRTESLVILDRHWPTTVAYAVGQDEDVDEAKWIGRWPPDILEPDVSILLTATEDVRLDRLRERHQSGAQEEARISGSARIREKTMSAYRAFKPVEVATDFLKPEEVVNQVIESIDASMGSDKWRCVF
jgi:thymidylate kinase